MATFERSLFEGITKEPLANSMLVIMVRGLFTHLQFPYAQFPCTSLCGDQLFAPFWEAVCQIERCGLKVLGLTCDGLAANRRLFRLHSPEASDLVHKVINPYAADGRHIFFISDPPHLLKTIRNCWENKRRPLWVRVLYSLHVLKCVIEGIFFLVQWKRDLVVSPSPIVREEQGTRPCLATQAQV